MEERLKNTLENIYICLNEVYLVLQNANLLNEQCVINWLDKINELSVRN